MNAAACNMGSVGLLGVAGTGMRLLADYLVYSSPFNFGLGKLTTGKVKSMQLVRELMNTPRKILGFLVYLRLNTLKG